MRINFIEISNFRKLQACRIEFDEQKTLLVGANNSGKTTAITALRKFLQKPKSIELKDIFIGVWSDLDQIGKHWESDPNSDLKIDQLLPQLDIWLDVPMSQIHHVVHIIPSINWTSGAVGVRLAFEIDNLDVLKTDYLAKRNKAKEIENAVTEGKKPEIEPRNLVDYLENRLQKYAVVKAYSLDPQQLSTPDSKGKTTLQPLSKTALELGSNPFQELINFCEIPAMRDFSAGNLNTTEDSANNKSERIVRTLSGHVRSYYDQHIKDSEAVDAEDIDAFTTMQNAEKAFDLKLKSGFKDVFAELENLGIPGVNNPSITINTKFKSIEGLEHASAVQYSVLKPNDEREGWCLPESYAGLGYQNLIAMVFLLMRFRQDWIDPKSIELDEIKIAPLQLVMIEEPEAHLHAQVQQVFIKKAYDVLRNHEALGQDKEFHTQLIVSTHSSHVAHEVEFSNIRYFRRLSESNDCAAPVSSIINLSHIFGKNMETLRFVKRYIRGSDCDLFFADAVIFVEGQAERILVPHFIRHHYGDLWRRYITIVDIGGSNAPRFEPLIKALGLVSLVITDLDAGRITKVPTKKGGKTTRILKTAPAVGEEQVTSNPTLKKWHPKLTKIDELVELNEKKHFKKIDNEYDLYVAYQKTVKDPTDSKKTLIPRTFEDAIVYENYDKLGTKSGTTTTNKIASLISSGKSGADLEAELFKIIKDAEKAGFALDCLNLDSQTVLSPPPYIAAGLSWLERKLDETNVGALMQEVTKNGE